MTGGNFVEYIFVKCPPPQFFLNKKNNIDGQNGIG